MGKGKLGLGSRKLDSCCSDGAKSWWRGSRLGGKREDVTSLVLRRSGKTGDTSPVVWGMVRKERRVWGAEHRGFSRAAFRSWSWDAVRSLTHISGGLSCCLWLPTYSSAKGSQGLRITQIGRDFRRSLTQPPVHIRGSLEATRQRGDGGGNALAI